MKRERGACVKRERSRSLVVDKDFFMSAGEVVRQKLWEVHRTYVHASVSRQPAPPAVGRSASASEVVIALAKNNSAAATNRHHNFTIATPNQP